ncbi:MAG: type II toxin-antitoxin system RelE/ParE family toxin [Patescibacteria group bacterium]|nr:type II toxin-antitoxin system RelE/ParE family toxin [Patescibacteria group bacterium]
MKYELIYTKSAAKDIKKLDLVVKKKIKKKLELYSQKPIFYAKKLIKSSLGSYRWRAGNYRVTFDLDKNKIVILRVGHRREIYR